VERHGRAASRSRSVERHGRAAARSTAMSKGGHEPARAGLGPSLLLARSKWARLGLARLLHELEKWARLELDGNSGWLGLARELDSYSHCHVGPTLEDHG
jgi:hypothetical protein